MTQQSTTVSNQVMWNRMISVVEEQAQALVRTAFSTSVREAGDLSAGVYNVGGEMLETCLNHLAMQARVVLCGSISEYMSNEPFGPRNYTNLRSVNGTMSGFKLARIAPGSVYEALGLRRGDVIQGANGRPLRNIDDALTLVGELSTADSVEIHIERSGTKRTLRYHLK